jgi:hypothetical protein
MTRMACEGCGKWVFEEAVVCPHCGKKQNRVAPQAAEGGKPALHVSPDEARALLAMAAMSRGEPATEDTRAGLTTWLLLPLTHGRKRPFEIGLTLLAGPLLLLVLFTVGLAAWKHPAASLRGTARTSVFMAAFSVFGLGLVLGLPTVWSVALPGAMLAAWVAREILRSRGRARL